MTIVNVGLSHRTAQPEILARLTPGHARRRTLLARLHAMPGIDEVVLLTTCTRVEAFAATSGLTDEAARALALVLAAGADVPVVDVLRMAAIRAGEPAIRHLFSVTCGPGSQAAGEEQALAQVRAARRAAAAAGTAGPVLTGLLDAALRAGKRARAQTAIGITGISLARAGLGLAGAHLGGELAGRDAVVLGTGSVGRLAARLLREAGAARLVIAGRSEAKAAEVAAAVGGTPLPAARLPAALAGAEVLVAATAAGAAQVLAADVRAARQLAGSRRLFVLDLGMPPDVEPAVGSLPGVALVNLAALGRSLSGQAAPGPVAQARAIADAGAATYLARRRQAAAGPLAAALHEQIMQLADAELARLHQRLPGLSDEQRAETTAAVHRILSTILHRPAAQAKELRAGPEVPAHLAALQQLFALGPAEAAGKAAS